MARITHRHDVFHRGKVPESQLATGTATDGFVVTATATGEAAWEASAGDVSQAEFDDHSARHENGGADEISLAGLDGMPTELTTHLGDAADAHDASAISFVPAGTIAATNVQAAIEEVATEAGGAHPDLAAHDTLGLATQAELDAHTGDTTDAHDASAISIVDAGTFFTGTDVEAALQELGAVPPGSGAPANIDYLVGTADAGLSNEIVVGTTPGGELGGTWASPTVDATHSGSTHAATQAAAEATAQAALDAHTGDTTDAHDASAVSFVPAGTIAATNVQAAIEEVATEAAGGHAEDHDHDGSPTQKLAQANTHESPDTDTGASSLHHTLGAGANQAAAGNHSHAGSGWDVEIVKPTDEDNASNTAVQADDHLTTTPTTGVPFIFEMLVAYSNAAGATPDLKIAVGEDTTVRGEYTAIGLGTSDNVGHISQFTRTDQTASFGAAAGQRSLWIQGVHTGAGGAFAFHWAQVVSNATPTRVHAGSVLRLRYID